MTFRKKGHDFAPAWWLLWHKLGRPFTAAPIVVVPKRRVDVSRAGQLVFQLGGP